MARLIQKSTRIEAAGDPPKVIREYIGRVNSLTDEVSIARMVSPEGWSEPFQEPEFAEYTLVLKGTLQVETEGESFMVGRDEAIVVNQGERVRYSTPLEGGAEYVAICLPAFSPETVHRESD